MTLAIIMSGLSMLISGSTLVAVLVLLGRGDFQYATKGDLEEVLARLVIVGRNQSRLYRYVEAVDGHLGANGHQVLGRWVPDDDAEDANR